jgi:LacI family transcriptional regulator
VSAASVSYALNGRPGVSEQTRRRILEEAAKVELISPDEVHARARTTIAAIGLVLGDIQNPFYADLARLVAEVARRWGFEVFSTHTNDDPKSIKRAVVSLLDHEVEAMILTAAQVGDATIFRLMKQARIPFVQISRRFPGLAANFVGIDDEAAGFEIMKHVLSHQYRDVAIVSGPKVSVASRDRRAGWLRALAQAKINLPTNRRLTTTLGEDGGREAAKFLLASSSLPDVVVCGSDAMAFGLIETFYSAGLCVPNDVAVTAYDGLNSASSRLLNLTTVVQPRSLMAEKAVSIVASALTRPKHGPIVTLCPHTLYIGNSCGCPGKPV